MSTTQEPNVQDMFSLKGKVALVTGAAGWLVQAFCRALAEAGASVVCAEIPKVREKAQEVAKSLPVVGNARHYVTEIDYMDSQSIDNCMADAVKQAGQVDIVVNSGYERVTADWTNVTGEAFTRQLQNATGVFLLCRAFRDHVLKRGGKGSIINIGSMYGIVGSYPDAYAGVAMASPVAYHCLKGGVISMTKHLAVYWVGDGIRVNTLTPGPFPAPNVNPTMVERLSSKCPMKRMGKPYELKGALVFLASDASSYVTGANIVVDGGWTAW